MAGSLSHIVAEDGSMTLSLVENGGDKMKTIWKYKLEVTDYQEISMPAGAKILTTRAVGQDIFVWAMVHTDAGGHEVIQFAVVGTGHEFPPGPWTYIGTCMMQDTLDGVGLMAPLFFHVFWR